MAQQSPNPTTAVAMSGGVDSSTVAGLLHSSGRSIVGLTMQLWNHRRLAGSDEPAGHRCCSADDVYDARRVAEHLEFPFYVINFEREFEAAVVRPFVDGYLSGRTPVPCTLCNNSVKFEELLVTARQIGAERLATGHYARVARNPSTGRYELWRAADASKDQSYFLWGLTQGQLSRTEFPLGGMTKTEVREVARRLKLPVAEKPESQEICFVPSGSYVNFLEKYRAEQGLAIADEGGEFVTTSGEVIGRHAGVHQFTIGQRHGLGVAAGRPLYVLEIDAPSRRVVLGEDAELRRDACELHDVNWISIAPPAGPVEAEVKLRHRHEPALATITPLHDDSARVRFASPQRAITPGQAAVFYLGERVLGGGWIR